METNSSLTEYIDLYKYWLVLKRRWVPATATFAGILALSLITALSLQTKYEADARVRIETNKSSKLTGLQNDIGEIEALTQDSDPIATEAEILSSRPLVYKLIEELDLKDDKGKTLKYKDAVASLKVKPVTGTDLIEVAYQDKDPELSASVVNKLLELYLEDNKTNNQSAAVSARRFISEQLPQVETNLRQAEANLRQFKNSNRVASLTRETDLTVENVSELENEVDAATAELRGIDARYNRLRAQLGMDWQEASAISSLSQSLAVQKALEQLQEVKVQLTQQRNYFSDSTPQVISLKEQEAQLTNLLNNQIQQTLGPGQSRLISNVNVLSLGDLKQAQIAEFADLGLQKAGLEEKLASLKGIYSGRQQKSDNLPQLEERQRELERKVKAAQSTYQTLLSKLQETTLAEQQNIANVRVVSSAVVPDEPAGLGRLVIVALGGLLGALSGLAVAFLLDLQDDTIKDGQEVESLLAYPIQGVIPDFRSLEGESRHDLPRLVSSDDRALPLKEAYQTIHVNLKLLDSTATSKIIAVTSSVPQEGKSTVGANLAVARLQPERRILLIDADMRRPRQHEIWEIPNNVGLSNVLEQTVSCHDAIQNVMPGLDVLTAGTIPDNPVGLIDSGAMEDVLATLSHNYDQIIVDTPPILGIADTRMLGKMVDGFLFVIRPGVAQYGNVTAAKKLMESTGQKVLGIIVNGVESGTEPYGYQYQNYYYSRS
jgi:capsular exopolysaccharide synthesis family protein